jgi:hypothetical protein
MKNGKFFFSARYMSLQDDEFKYELCRNLGLLDKERENMNSDCINLIVNNDKHTFMLMTS